jgi:hypothetical protein
MRCVPNRDNRLHQGRFAIVRRGLLVLICGCSGVTGTEDKSSETLQQATLADRTPSMSVMHYIDEECQILRDVIEQAVIPESWAADDKKGVILVASESAVTSQKSIEELQNVEQDMLRAFSDANMSRRRWPPAFKLSREARFVDDAAMAEMIRDGGWRRVQREIPGACEIVRVSRPGVSHDHQSALVFWSFSGGPLSGGGAFVLMRKRGESWRVERTVQSVVY